ncbi:MAG: nucleotidyltransferase family protein [Candidatus Woesearchaeota archaeon]
MLKIINELILFFEDTTIELGVREYASLQNVSPPTASTILQKFGEEGVLKKTEFRKTHLYSVNREQDVFGDLSRIYWKGILRKHLKDLHEQVLYSRIVLFGSIAKATNTKESDIDLYIDSEQQDVDVDKIEKKLGRSIDVHFKDSKENKQLAHNIKEGITLFE